MITSELMHDVAIYTNSRVAKVVLNGTFAIEDFTVKEVTEHVLALNYIVPAAEVSLITLIELMDDEDNVISSNEVNVPVTSDTLMLQTIEVKEVGING